MLLMTHFPLRRPMARLTLSSLLLLPLLGCANPNPTPHPESGSVADAPKTPAQKATTSFSPALQCMDGLMLSHNKHDITITSAGIVDSTEKVSVGSKDMLINALNQMSRRSRAFTFIDYDPEHMTFFSDAARASNTGHTVPNYYIRGAISQLDNNVQGLSAESVVSSFMAESGLTANKTFTIMSVDMNVGETISHQVIADAGASNSIIITQDVKGNGDGTTIPIGKIGPTFNIALSETESTSSAARALIELNAIESMGELTHTPYWKCLQTEKTYPKAIVTARGWFDDMKPEERARFVQSKLAANKLYQGPVDGQSNQSLTDTLARYQSQNHIIADGRINFDTYFSLLSNEQLKAEGAPLPELPPKTINTAEPLAVRVTSERGDRPTYRQGEILVANLLVNRDSYVYCYYQDAKGTIARLFPNHFQAAEPYLTRRDVVLSADHQPVKIRFDQANSNERIGCYASNTNMKLPLDLNAKEFAPLQVRSLDDLSTAVQQSNPSGIVESRLEIQVQ
ncbi:MAG: DUF4384 domain-containing protein [Alphaproteobacteria bacterium]|nr:DUF4384 domain-containing protein [Alphaproteobacteria bacterium]